MAEEEKKDPSISKQVNLTLSRTATEFECPLDSNKNKIGKRREQQDAAEFLLNSILNKVEKEVLKVLTFSLQTESYCRSKSGVEQQEKGNPETQFILPLQLTESTSVQKSIDHYFKEETLDDPLDRCKGEGLTSHKLIQLSVGGSQEYLLVQLGRFSLGEKLDTPITLDTSLNIADIKWDLEGIVLHSGSLSSGHYRYLWKDPLQMWFLFDDSTVEDKEKQYLETEQVKKDSYILLYKKTKASVTSRSRQMVGKLWNYARTQTRKAKTSLGKIKDSIVKKVFKEKETNLDTATRKKRRIKENKLRRNSQKKHYSKTFITEILKNRKARKTYKNKKYTEDPLIKELVYNVLDN
jgi:hypothetical protein